MMGRAVAGTKSSTKKGGKLPEERPVSEPEDDAPISVSTKTAKESALGEMRRRGEVARTFGVGTAAGVFRSNESMG